MPSKRNTAGLGKRTILEVANRIRDEIDRQIFAIPLSVAVSPSFKTNLEANRTTKEVAQMPAAYRSPNRIELLSNPRTD